MSQIGDTIGNRLGISKEWESEFGLYNYKENLKNVLFFRGFITKIFKRFRMWCLGIKYIKKKNFVSIHLLTTVFGWRRPLSHKIFFVYTLTEFWYSVPVASRMLQITVRRGFLYEQKMYPLSKFITRHWRKKYVKLMSYFKILIIFLENYLNFKFLRILLKYTNIKIYNLLEYYDNFKSNHITIYVSSIIKLFPELQFNAMRGNKKSKNLKTSLFYICLGIIRKNSAIVTRAMAYEAKYSRRWWNLVTLMLRFVRQTVLIVPDINYDPKKEQKLGVKQILVNYEKDREGKEYIWGEDRYDSSVGTLSKRVKITIKGKIEGDRRAVRKTYYFSKVNSLCVPLQTFNLDVDYSHLTAVTKGGTLGIKVWIY